MLLYLFCLRKTFAGTRGTYHNLILLKKDVVRPELKKDHLKMLEALDIKKALDSLPHYTTDRTLHDVDVRKRTVNLIKTFLKNRKGNKIWQHAKWRYGDYDRRFQGFLLSPELLNGSVSILTWNFDVIDALRFNIYGSDVAICTKECTLQYQTQVLQ